MSASISQLQQGVKDMLTMLRPYALRSLITNEIRWFSIMKKN